MKCLLDFKSRYAPNQDFLEVFVSITGFPHIPSDLHRIYLKYSNFCSIQVLKNLEVC